MKRPAFTVRSSLRGLCAGARLALLVVLCLLSACQAPSVQPPPVNHAVQAYLHWLQQTPTTADADALSERQLANYYFLPLRPKTLQALKDELHQTRQRLRQTGLQPRVLATRQDGRWAVAVLGWQLPVDANKKLPRSEKNSLPNKTGLWLFYYRDGWRVIAPPLYGSKEVRSLMNLYPQHQALNRWLLSKL